MTSSLCTNISSVTHPTTNVVGFRARTAARSGRVTVGPKNRDIDGSVQVSIHRAVFLAAELKCIALTTFSALMTGLRRIGRVHQDQTGTSILSFVSEKLPELIKRPTGLMVALSLSDLHPLAYPRQVFQRNRSDRVLCGIHNAAADDVVDVAHMPTFPARQAFQGALSALRPLGLERAADFGVVPTKPVNFFSFVDSSIGIDGDAAATKINP